MPKSSGTEGTPFDPAQAAELLTPTWDDIALRLGFAAAFGIAASAAYFLTQRKKRSEAASFVATMVLLAILLAMVSMVIGSNIARAFALVGALSIVRFRTVVEDTRDTAFVIFAVVVGMAAGSGAYLVAAVGIPIVGLVAWMLAYWGRSGERARSPLITGSRTKLVVRIGLGIDPNKTLASTIERFATNIRVVALATVKQGAAMDVTYTINMLEGANAPTMISELNRVEGVQGVEWKAENDKDKDD